MTPRHAADRLTARIRAWWGVWRQIPEASRKANNRILAELGRPPLKTWRERRAERRAQRDADDEEEASWLDSLPLPEDWAEAGPFDTWKPPGQRYHGPHAQPGDIPDQPAGGAE